VRFVESKDRRKSRNDTYREPYLLILVPGLGTPEPGFLSTFCSKRFQFRYIQSKITIGIVKVLMQMCKTKRNSKYFINLKIRNHVLSKIFYKLNI